MDTGFFLRGLAIGFSIAAVVGPIGMLCIQRTLHNGFFYGLVSGLGAATADGIYGSIAAFGLTVISTLLLNQQNWIRLIGGLFLGYLGIKAILTRPVQRIAPATSRSFPGAYASTLLLTLTNPLTILSFATVFAGLGVVGQNGWPAALVTAGVFCGSCAWWLFLSGGVGLLRRKMTTRWLVWINRLAGTALLIFALLALLGLLF
jgi:threonine/homoserine/homoserine lactone efflux protein